MPRLVNCIKNCCYTLLILTFICAISSLFVWQAEVYQSTIDEQVRLMKMDLSSIKKENHLMEVKVNEQFGKHEDLKDEFRYLLKQAKWQLGKGADDDVDDDIEELDDRENVKVIPNNMVNIVNNLPEHGVVEGSGGNALNNALLAINDDEMDEMDLSKRTHILVLSEKKGGGEQLGKLIGMDENLFYFPSISSVVKTSKEFEQIAHCTISAKVVDFYKTHLAAVKESKSLWKLCPEGSCAGLTAGDIELECLTKHISVLEGSTEHWNLQLIDSLSMEIAYVSRDPRAIISEYMEDGTVSEEEVQVFAAQLCARMESFTAHSSSSHNVYEVFKYEVIAASPITSLSTLYHKLLDTTNIPPLNLTKDYKNGLYLSISDWKNKLPQISVDAVNEECSGIIDGV